MALRRFLGATAGTIGAIAAANQVIASRAGPLDPPLGREPGTYRWRGMDVAYTELGDPTDSDIVLVHGIYAAGTSREFIRIAEQLADDRHVLVPDLPGFGRSDRPPLVYSAPFYAAFVRDFVADLTEEATCVATSLSGAYTVDVADELDLSKLVLICPTATTRRGGHRAAGNALRLPLFGTGGFNALVSKPALRHFMTKQGVYDSRALAPGDLAYFWKSAHQPGARYAPASLVGGYLDIEIELGEAIEDLDTEATLVWGREARIPSLHAGRDLAERGDVKLVVIDRTRTLPHYEQPDAFLDLLADELTVSEVR